MGTYSDHEQRLLDQQSGAALDRQAQRREANAKPKLRRYICVLRTDSYGPSAEMKELPGGAYVLYSDIQHLMTQSETTCEHPLGELLYHGFVSGRVGDYRCNRCNEVIYLPALDAREWSAARAELKANAEPDECEHQWLESVSRPGTRVCDACGARQRSTLDRETEEHDAHCRSIKSLDIGCDCGGFDLRRFERAPCYLCGYNGECYYRPEFHPCAALYHERVAVKTNCNGEPT
jgi:hypothetical protein